MERYLTPRNCVHAESTPKAQNISYKLSGRLCSQSIKSTIWIHASLTALQNFPRSQFSDMKTFRKSLPEQYLWNLNALRWSSHKISTFLISGNPEQKQNFYELLGMNSTFIIHKVHERATGVFLTKIQSYFVNKKCP